MADGSLTALLFQFPQSFRYEPDNRVYLAGLLAEFSGYPSVVEFRSDAWMQNRVYDGLEARGAGICVCDLPSLRGLPKLVPVATGGRGYIRFHGLFGQQIQNYCRVTYNSRQKCWDSTGLHIPEPALF